MKIVVPCNEANISVTATASAAAAAASSRHSAVGPPARAVIYGGIRKLTVGLIRCQAAGGDDELVKGAAISESLKAVQADEEFRNSAEVLRQRGLAALSLRKNEAKEKKQQQQQNGRVGAVHGVAFKLDPTALAEAQKQQQQPHSVGGGGGGSSISLRDRGRAVLEAESRKRVSAMAATTIDMARGKEKKNFQGEGTNKSFARSDFLLFLQEKGLEEFLVRRSMTTVQVNVGLLCNLACAHCHVDASPRRTEAMDATTAQKLVRLLEVSKSVETLDLTGGAPELNPNFRFLVTEGRRLGLEVIDRCNLTVLFEPGQEDLAEFLAANKVRVVASLPCYSSENVDKQRGKGVFNGSIEALSKLNAIGYGREGSGLVLDLVYNPLGAFLPPPQAELEVAYKRELRDKFGIVFNNLFTITNMPIKRFAHHLKRTGEMEKYMNLLVSSFNAAALENVMCRDLISIRWDGLLYDCDFNQQLTLSLPPSTGLRSIFDLKSFDHLVGAPIACGSHCFGCTAGQGSSCTGATSG